MSEIKKLQSEVLGPKQEYLQLFPVVVQITKLDLNIDSIIEFCHEMKREDEEGVIKSNVSGWQSVNLVDEVYSDEFSKLKTEIEVAINKYHFEIDFRKNLKQKLDNIWANINHRGALNELHVHPRSALSGTFYLTKNEEPTPIIFQHPCREMSQHYWGDYGIGKWSPINSGEFGLDAEPNILLVFPPWVWHRVSMNKGDKDRISLSFNSVFEETEEGNQAKGADEERKEIMKKHTIFEKEKEGK